VRAAGGGGVAATVSIPFHDAAGAHHRRWSFAKIRTLSGGDEALARHTLSLLPGVLPIGHRP